MRRRIVKIAVVVVLILALVTGILYFGLGWWHPSRTPIIETATAHDADCESATLPEAMALAHQAVDEIEHNVHDYSARIIKKERISKTLVGRELLAKDFITSEMFAKIREKPFSVYLKFLYRSDNELVKDRQVLYVQGRNGDMMLVHSPHLLGRSFTLPVDPKGWLATPGEHYPITEIGLANLCRQLIQRGESLGDPSQVRVTRYRHARINTRACALLEVTYPAHESDETWGYLARVFVDDQWHFPIRVAVYKLPVDRSQGPQLVEAYTYLHVKLNNGYSDADFDPKDPQYKFPEKSTEF